LENVLERAIINCRGSKEISIEDLNHYVSNDYFVIKDDQPDSIMPLEKAEIMLIKNAIKKHGSSYEGKREAAKTLGISLATLYNKINKYKIEINN
jgi:transcriptional regulator with PAS, ATPase and Fis domain